VTANIDTKRGKYTLCKASIIFNCAIVTLDLFVNINNVSDIAVSGISWYDSLDIPVELQPKPGYKFFTYLFKRNFGGEYL